MIKAIIFDMDGVLVDSFYTWLKTINLAAKYFGCPEISEEKFRKHFGGPTKGDIEFFMPERTVEELDNFYAENFSKFVSETKLVENAKELLNELEDRGVKIGLATNTPRNAAEKQLEFVRIRKYFKTIVAGDDVENPKPSPCHLIKTIHEMNVSKDEVIYVGDSIYDIEAAKNAGIFMIGYKIDSDARIDNLIDLPRFLEEKC